MNVFCFGLVGGGAPGRVGSGVKWASGIAKRGSYVFILPWQLWAAGPRDFFPRELVIRDLPSCLIFARFSSNVQRANQTQSRKTFVIISGPNTMFSNEGQFLLAVAAMLMAPSSVCGFSRVVVSDQESAYAARELARYGKLLSGQGNKFGRHGPCTLRRSMPWAPCSECS
jgi:hypothetical protein